jgi:hypothetical protein
MSAETLFNQNFPAIQAAKQQTGDWEKAFQLVTGQKWPSGQHITVDGAGGHMVKDTSGWKKFAKVALPVGAAIAAPFTGGASMAALLGAGTGAVSGALDGGWKGALTGGAMGALSGYGANKIGGLLKGVGKSGVPGVSGSTPGSSISELMKNANVPMGHVISDVNAVNGGASGGGGGIWGGLVNAGKKIIGAGGPGNTDETGGDQKWADASTMLDEFGKGELARRFIRGEMTQNYDQLNMDAAKTNAGLESDALRKLAQTSYLKSGGAKPMNFNVASGRMTDFGFGPRPASAEQMQGAGTLEQTLLKRLTPEGMIKPTDPSYLNEGTAEKIGKWGGVITGGVGAAKNIFGW